MPYTPYTVQADIEVAAGGQDRLIELADVNGAGEVSQAVLLDAQTSAEQWIHSYAQKRFVVPFAPVPSLIKQYAAQETVYRLMQLRQMVPDWAKEQHEERRMWLEDLARGLVNPGVDPDPPKSTAVVPETIERSILEPVSRRALKGFWQMAGFVEVELDDVLDGLDAMVRAGKDLRPVWKAAKSHLRADLQKHFDDSTGPEGAWSPRSAASVDRVLSTGGRRRNVTRKGKIKKGAVRRLARNQLGKLRSAWRISYDRRQIVASSMVSWAGIHQFGGTAGHGVTIPARPFAWVSEELVGAVAYAIRDHIAHGWQK